MPVGLAAVAALALILSACSAAGDDEATSTATAVQESSTPAATADESSPSASAVALSSSYGPTTGDCEATAATFCDVQSANADLDDPELSAVCDGDSIVVTSNSIPDYVYVATTPGSPSAVEATYVLPATPVPAADPSPDDVPLLGAVAVAIDGVAMYGPTEGTGGDVLSLEGAISECGSHNGPVDFHAHLFGWAEDVDCLYSADEVNSGEPILVGWAADGYPIMSGLVCEDDDCSSMTQLESSWELTDETAFATDTWAAHTYVERSGDLDQCNGRVDEDGQYRYYTTETFPYLIGCYYGEVSDDAIAAGGDAGGPGGP